MTPRQLSHWVKLIGQSQREELATSLTISALGARGDPKDIKKLHRKLTRT